MAKTIKFNLICDNRPIRTIEDLQENFEVGDIWKYYNSRLLHRWLEVRGYKKELEEISKIGSIKQVDVILRELIRIFELDADESEIQAGIHILENESRIKNNLDCLDSVSFQKELLNYELGFKERLDAIENNPNDILIIKKILQEIDKHYDWIFRIESKQIYYRLREKSLVTILCSLMFEKLRRNYIVDENDTEEKNGKIEIFHDICDQVKNIDSLKEILGDQLKIVSEKTNQEWRELEPLGKKVMIISLQKGDIIRNIGGDKKILESESVKNKFLLLDGLEYKSNDTSRSLVYMEV